MNYYNFFYENEEKTCRNKKPGGNQKINKINKIENINRKINDIIKYL